MIHIHHDLQVREMFLLAVFTTMFNVWHQPQEECDDLMAFGTLNGLFVLGIVVAQTNLSSCRTIRCHGCEFLIRN